MQQGDPQINDKGGEKTEHQHHPVNSLVLFDIRRTAERRGKSRRIIRLASLFSVPGTTTGPARLVELCDLVDHPRILRCGDPSADFSVLDDLDGLLIAMAPTTATYEEDQYRAVYGEAVPALVNALRERPRERPLHVSYLSSAGIYGDQSGAITTELSPPDLSNATNAFLVEAISASAFLFIFLFFGLTTTTLLFFMLIISFIIIFFIDLKHFIIPNQITYSLMIIGFFKSFDPFLDRSIFPDYFHSLIGGVCGYFVIWLLIFVYKKLKNKEGMGLGDAKLLSALGFWFGWISIPFILIFSSLTALGFSLPSLIKKSKNLSTEIPFGPHLVVGCVLYVVFIDEIFKYLI